MPFNHSLRVRGRLALAAGLVTITGATLLSATPAGAEVERAGDSVDAPTAGSGSASEASGRFDTPLNALVQAVYRAERSAADVQLTRRDLRAKADHACLAAGGPDANIPTLVAEIFRCRLQEAGVSEAQADRWAAEAVVIARCESLWDTNAVVFNGKYLDTPHANGNRYSAAGVFQFIRATAEKWIDGGYANVHKARRNIDAAARLFIHNRVAGLGGWEDWACAAANDGFKVGSVLPGWPGGPAELPAWAWKY